MKPTYSETDTTEQSKPTQSRLDMSSEIDLRRILVHLWKSRVQVLLFAALGAGMAVGYAFLSPTTYVAIAKIRAPSPTELAPINETQIVQVAPMEAYRDVIDVLHSEGLLKQIYQDQLAIWYKKTGRERSPSLGNTLGEIVTINLPRNLRTNFYNSDITEIVVRHPDEDFAVLLANGLIDRANSIATHNLIEETRQLIEYRIESIDEKLQQIRELSGATDTGANDGLTPQSLPGGSAREDPGEVGELPTEGPGGNSEYFTETLDELRYRRAVLKTNKVYTFDGLSLVSVHEPASLPAKVSGPGTLLVTVMGLLAGTFCGFTVALLLFAVKNEKP